MPCNVTNQNMDLFFYRENAMPYNIPTSNFSLPGNALSKLRNKFYKYYMMY